MSKARIQTPRRQRVRNQGRDRLSRSEQQRQQLQIASFLRSPEAFEFFVSNNDDISISENESEALSLELDSLSSEVGYSDESHDADYVDFSESAVAAEFIERQSGFTDSHWHFQTNRTYTIAVSNSGRGAECELVLHPWMQVAQLNPTNDGLAVLSLTAKLVKFAATFTQAFPEFLSKPCAVSFANDWVKLAAVSSDTEWLAEVVPWNIKLLISWLSEHSGGVLAFTEEDFSRSKDSILFCWPTAHLPLSAFGSFEFEKSLKVALLRRYCEMFSWNDVSTESSENELAEYYKKLSTQGKREYSKRVQSKQQLSMLWCL